MSPKLKPLLLPQLLLEEQKRRLGQSVPEPEMEFPLASSVFSTHNSSASEIPSPVTPTFSTRGHLRYPSSVSSIESSYNSPNQDSPSSPIYLGGKTGKRSLPDVQEEPHEREEDFDMFDDDELYDCLCKCAWPRPSARDHWKEN